MVGIGVETARDRLAHALKARPDLGAYLGASVATGFDGTTTRMLVDEAVVRAAEMREYGAFSNRPDLSAPEDAYERMAAKRSRLLRNGGELSARGGAYELGRSSQIDDAARFRMSEDQWKESEYFREGMAFDPKMTPVRARIYAEEYDKRRRREEILQRGGGGLRSVLGFGAQMLGSVPDPVNLLPLASVSRNARLSTRVGGAVLEGAVGTAIADSIVLPDLKRRGMDLSWEDAALDVLFGAGIGALVGGGGAIAHDLRVRRMRKHAPAPVRETVGRAGEKALEDFSQDRPVDVSDPLQSEAQQLHETVEAVDRLYDRSLFHPLQNDPQAQQVRMRSLVAESLDPVWREIVMDSGSGTVRRKRIRRDVDYGLTKVIYEHGEGSKNRAEKQVAREDLLDFPRVVRDFHPSDVTRDADGVLAMRWAVRGKRGEKVVHVAKLFRDADGMPHLVTSHVANEAAPYKFSRKIWPKERADLRASLKSSSEGLQDTGPGASIRPHGDVLSRGAGKSAVGKEADASTLSANNIAPAKHKVNWSTEKNAYRPAPDVARDEDELLRGMGIDPQTRMSREESDVDILAQDGLLDEAEAVELVEAREVDEQAGRYEDAGFSVIECVLKVVDDAD